MMRVFRFVLLALAMSSPLATAHADDVRLIRSELELKFAPTPGVPAEIFIEPAQPSNRSWFGEVEWITYMDGETLLDINVGHLDLPAGTVLVCMLNGRMLASIKLGPRGFAGIELSGKQMSAELMIQAGDTVTVEVNGLAVLEGTFVVD